MRASNYSQTNNLIWGYLMFAADHRQTSANTKGKDKKRVADSNLLSLLHFNGSKCAIAFNFDFEAILSLKCTPNSRNSKKLWRVSRYALTN